MRALDRIVGAFVFPEVWQAWTAAEAATVLASLRGLGVNTISRHPHLDLTTPQTYAKLCAILPSLA